MNIEVRLEDEDFLGGIVTARGVSAAPTPAELTARIDEVIASRSGEEFPPARIKEGVRGMLRKGGFKPSGRNKPSSEYLAQAAREGRFPRINNLVDINNLLSFESGLPMSLLDAEAFGDCAEIRYGAEGEKYVFNPAGQEIELAGLICICGGGKPMGNPIKDSMAAKLKDSTRDVIGVVYATRCIVDANRLEALLHEFAELLRRFGNAASTEQRIVSP